MEKESIEFIHNKRSKEKVMSKAQKYLKALAAAHAAAPKEIKLGGPGTNSPPVSVQVAGSGDVFINSTVHSVFIPQEEAIKLADWLYENFMPEE